MRKLLFPLGALIFLIACDDIFETDISGKEVSIVAPVGNTVLSEGDISFLWNHLDGADRYRVTIVSPNFHDAAVAVKDTLVYADSLSLSLSFHMRLVPADYQWSIQAFNEFYESLKSAYDLTITSETDGL